MFLTENAAQNKLVKQLAEGTGLYGLFSSFIFCDGSVKFPGCNIEFFE